MVAADHLDLDAGVPVLSVQITVVDPSVSTALSRLTAAPRRAGARTPTASAGVIVGSRYPPGEDARRRLHRRTPAGRHGAGDHRRDRPTHQHRALVATHPAAAARIGRLVVMGGVARGGNATPTSEFNIWSDPEAAYRVFAADAVGFYSRFHQARYGTTDTYQHDALAVAEVIAPGIVRTSHLHVEVEYGQGPTRGTTAVDVHGVTGHAPNTHVALELDHPRFVDLLVSRLDYGR
jgi:hypothetical protein